MSELVVVTGASSGIGTELARQLHARGHRVMLVARREDRLKSLAAELEKLRADSTVIRVCDLSNRSEVEKLAEELSRAEVYGLINNAGIGSLGAFKDLDIKSEISQIELNVVAPLILIRAVAKSMCERKRGFIINVSSIMAYKSYPYVATYAATKAFEFRHSMGIQRELESFGVRVLTLCPGPTETEFFGIAKVPNGGTNFKRAPAAYVAKVCLQDLDAGKKVSIPTLKAKLLVLGAIVTPTPIYTWVVKRALRRVLKI